MFYRLAAERLEIPFPAPGPGPTPPHSTWTFPLPPGPQAHGQNQFPLCVKSSPVQRQKVCHCVSCRFMSRVTWKRSPVQTSREGRRPARWGGGGPVFLAFLKNEKLNFFSKNKWHKKNLIQYVCVSGGGQWTGMTVCVRAAAELRWTAPVVPSPTARGRCGAERSPDKLVLHLILKSTLYIKHLLSYRMIKTDLNNSDVLSLQSCTKPTWVQWYFCLFKNELQLENTNLCIEVIELNKHV